MPHSSHLTRNYLMGFLIAAAPLWIVSCGRKPTSSKVEVTSVQYTSVKKQELGNCWLYATASWAESMHLAATGESTNLSETYWTYVDWYEKIQRSRSDEIDAGGTWSLASELISKYGFMYEDEFAPGEEKTEASESQDGADDAINKALSSGILRNPKSRTPENIIKALDEAFGVDFNALKMKVHRASSYIVGHDDDGYPYSLDAVLYGTDAAHTWHSVNYPRLYERFEQPTKEMIAARKAVMVRVMKALNDHQPVIMSVMVDFNAIKKKPYSTFDLGTYNDTKKMGDQGGHLVVLNDYAVENAPGYGSIGEGEVTPQMKEAALKGDLLYLKAKNSWGTNRAKRGLTDGYTAFTAGYLNATMPWQRNEDDDNVAHASWYTPLRQFILPSGY